MINIEEFREIKLIISESDSSLCNIFNHIASIYIFDRNWDSIENMNAELGKFCAIFS